ncbi:MAG: hypothetical protein AB1489_41325 [Acidobacteriota bacterium]
MQPRTIKLVTLGFIIVSLIGLATFGPTVTTARRHKKNTGLADPQVLLSKFNNWKVTLAQPLLRIPLGWFQGLSTEYSTASGNAIIDLHNGSVSIEIHGLADAEWEFWLIDNQPGPGYSTMPDAGDAMINIGSFHSKNGLAKLSKQLPSFTNFEIDRAIVTRAGQSPINAFVLTGELNLFERLARKQSVSSKRSSPITEAIAQEQLLEQLIANGRSLFLNTTFDGNGRTCATCHREENNFTIDAKFIATLPANDPLFVAETNPALANNFEKPALLRKFGLILENVDGSDDLTNKFTLRSVQHTLALPTSITAPIFQDVDATGSPNDPRQRLGWGGDGAPGNGSLREFATGAVIQHFTKTLNRRAGSDFRLPTDEELDALEAFQLSLGRQEDLDLNVLQLRIESARQGQLLFSSPGCCNNGDTVRQGKCAACHFGGGASSGFSRRNFLLGICATCSNTGINATHDIGSQNLDMVQMAGLPPDGGFGRTPIPNNGGFGLCPTPDECQSSFNVPTVIEAADTPPFFHHNLIATIEEAVAFYSSPEFNNSNRAKQLLPDGSNLMINLTNEENDAIAAFLRVINAIENIRSSISILQRARQMGESADAQDLIRLSIAETEDAIEVLTGGVLRNEFINSDRGPLFTAVLRLNTTRTLLINAAQITDTGMRNEMLNQVIQSQRKARFAIVNPTTLPTSFAN